MNPRKRWMTVGAVVAFTGAGFLTGNAIALNNADSRDGGSAVMLKAGATDLEPVADVDDSPESADSPNESAEDSADSPFDSPDDSGYIDPSPESADSPNESADDSPVSAPAPAPAVVQQQAPQQQAPAPAPRIVQADSPDSPDSPDSADSP